MAKTAVITLAGLIADALRKADFGASAEEHDMAVRVVNPDNGHSTTIWLPDDRTDTFIWGPSFQFDMPGHLPVSELVRRITEQAKAGLW